MFPVPQTDKICQTFDFLFFLAPIAYIDLVFIVSLIVCGGPVFGLVFNIQYFASFEFCDHLDGEERAGCFTLTLPDVL